MTWVSKGLLAVRQPDPTSGHIEQDLEKRLRAAVHVDHGADHGVEEDDKRGAQGRDEEPHLLLVRVAVAHVRAEHADRIEAKEARQAHGRVELCVGEALEGVDDDEVRFLARVDTLDAHQVGDLARCDADG